MPRRVDRRERRTGIADALMRVAAERGLEAVSLRHVAAEAGVSTGMVQHHFRDKDEMMSFALEIVKERGQARVEAAVAALGDDPPPRLLLRTMITALLPLDEEARAVGRVALAFLAYTAVRPEAARPLHENTGQLIEVFAKLLPGSESEAAALIALMEGLGLYLIQGFFTPEQALAALDVHLPR